MHTETITCPACNYEDCGRAEDDGYFECHACGLEFMPGTMLATETEGGRCDYQAQATQGR